MFSTSRKISLPLAGIIAASFVMGAASPTYANASSGQIVSASSAVDSTSSNPLPKRSIEDVKNSAKAQGLDADATEMAIELQKIINAYHELPEDLKGLPFEDPQVQEALLSKVAQSSTTLGRFASPTALIDEIDPLKASKCALTVAGLFVKTAGPVGVAWNLITTFGDVVEFAQAVTGAIKEARNSTAITVVEREYGKAAATAFGRILGYPEVINNCSNIKKR